MRVNRVKGKQAIDTIEDQMSDALAKHYTVIRQKTIGTGKTFIADIALPDERIVVERQGKQENKEIMAEMARERIAREAGWNIFRFNESELRNDSDMVLHRLRRELERIAR